MKKSLYMMLLAMISFMPAFANNGKLRVAVFDPTSSGTAIDEGTKIAVREIISSTIVNAGKYDIVERSMLEKVMQEQSFSNSGAVDDNDATEIGKLAGANKVVLSVVTLTGGRNMLSIKMIDVTTASVDRQKVKIVSSGELLDVVEDLTCSLIDVDNNAPTVSFPVQKPATRKTTDHTPKRETAVRMPESDNSGIIYKKCRYNVPLQYREFQKTSDFPKMYANNNFNVILDFSETTIFGIRMLDYLNSKESVSDDFYQEMMSETHRFIDELNAGSKKLHWDYNSQYAITLVVKVRDIDDRGRKGVGDFVFVETGSGLVLGGVMLQLDGGRFGSFPNLLGDALEESASTLFKILKKELPK